MFRPMQLTNCEFQGEGYEPEKDQRTDDFLAAVHAAGHLIQTVWAAEYQETYGTAPAIFATSGACSTSYFNDWGAFSLNTDDVDGIDLFLYAAQGDFAALASFAGKYGLVDLFP